MRRRNANDKRKKLKDEMPKSYEGDKRKKNKEEQSKNVCIVRKKSVRNVRKRNAED